ncbi:gliding motility-associated ABC transporter substrate-binding protein GldG [Polaribacter gochangensis]|uniref:gliding motility-associated ABC transporter substrate-binding protein GldG n=1 Tax=Polaribacter gochangensis TaxID=3252903 RepID=UPI0039048457
MSKNLKFIAKLVLGLLLINFLGNQFYKRFDLTQDKRYTLTNTTTSIIKSVDKVLNVKVYLEGDFPSEFKRLQIETKQFLEELRAVNSNIRIQFINPDTFREELIKKGLIPSRLTVEEDGKLSEAIIFPWAEISYQNKANLVNLLPSSNANSQDEQLQNAIESLEFSFASAINNINRKNKQKIAVLSGNGQLEDVYLYSFLKDVATKYSLAKFTLDSVLTNPQKTLKDLSSFDLAIIAKPTIKFSDEEKLTLDQFITNGGKTLWMIDNVQADQDSLLQTGKMLAYPRDLNLTDLLFAYGVRINTTIIKDSYAAKIPLATGNVGNQTQFQYLPWVFHPLVNGNADHPITKNIRPVRLQFTTQIDTLKNNIKKTPLLATSLLSGKLGTPNFVDLKTIADEQNPNEYKSGKQLTAVLLEGKFNSAYKNRIKPFKTSLYKEQSTANKMVVIADGDIAKNQILKNQPYDLSTDKWTQETFGNKEFLLNTVDYLLDDDGLINLRNKSLKINLLDKQKAFQERSYWQFFNVLLPLLLLAIFGFVFNYLRKRKYT